MIMITGRRAEVRKRQPDAEGAGEEGAMLTKVLPGVRI